jgi:hypothetical protein
VNFWVLLGGITILVVGTAGVVALLSVIFDAWGPLEAVLGTVGLIVWISFFIWIGVAYANGPLTKVMP